MAALICIIAVVLALAVLVAPAPAFAETQSGDGWSFDTDTGVLTVSSNAGTRAWRSFVDKGDVKSVVATDDVTTISEIAFHICCKNLS